MRKLIATGMVVGVVLSACASNPDNFRAADVSPIQYRPYDCDQIGSESARISRKVNDLYDNLKKKADTDAWQMGLGLVLFWPTLFFLEGGDGPEATEYKQLKGEYDALQQESIGKKCNITFKPLDADIKAKVAADNKKAEQSKKMPE